MNDFCLKPGSRFEGAPRRHTSIKTSLSTSWNRVSSGVVALTIDWSFLPILMGDGQKINKFADSTSTKWFIVYLSPGQIGI